MAIVDTDLVYLTSAGVKTNFSDAYIVKQENAAWKSVAIEIPTTLPIQKYAWLGRGAIMQQFQGEVAEQSAIEYDYKLADILYKGNMAVERRSLEDDQYDEIMKRARGLGAEPTRHWNQLVFGVLSSGFSTLCYDGQYLFNNSHSSGASGNQNNITNAALSDAALETAEATMGAYVDDKGIPMEIVPDTLVVGPALKRRAWNLTKSKINVTHVGDGTAGTGALAATDFENYFEGRYKVVVSPYLINCAAGNFAYNWFLADCSREDMKPVIMQSRSDVPVTLETDMDEPTAKIKEQYQITARGRYVAAPGLWQLIYGSNATS